VASHFWTHGALIAALRSDRPQRTKRIMELPIYPLILLVISASSLSIVPKPLKQTTHGPTLHLDAQNITFTATGKDSPLLQAAFKRYAALIVPQQARAVK
jgi:hypothetical protein